MWRYRIPSQAIVKWPEFLTVLLEIQFNGGMRWSTRNSSRMHRIAAIFPTSRNSTKMDSSWRGVFWGPYLPGR
jgi:hypothetical protein